VAIFAQDGMCSCYLGSNDDVTNLKAIFRLLNYRYRPTMLNEMVGSQIHGVCTQAMVSFGLITPLHCVSYHHIIHMCAYYYIYNPSLCTYAGETLSLAYFYPMIKKQKKTFGPVKQQLNEISESRL
jgi:hypothetical protein